MKKSLYTLYSLLFATCAFAQQNNDTVGSPDGLRADGKIYVVAAVLLAIFVGFIIYLVRLDSKISKIEKQQLPKR